MDAELKPKFSPWHSLKTRATVFMLVVFVLGSWSLTFYVSRSLQADMQRLLGEQQLSVVTAVGNQCAGGHGTGLTSDRGLRQDRGEFCAGRLWHRLLVTH